MDFIQAHMILWGVLAVLCTLFVVFSQLGFIALVFGAAAQSIASFDDKDLPKVQARTLLDQSPMNRRPAPFANPVTREKLDSEFSERETKKAVGSALAGAGLFVFALVGANAFGLLFIVAALANIFR